MVDIIAGSSGYPPDAVSIKVNSSGKLEALGVSPVGSVIAWLKTFTNTPALPTGWVECNGQVLSDALSVYNGQTIPNLNGNSEATKLFLRGSTTSGGTGGSATINIAHSHTYTGGGGTNTPVLTNGGGLTSTSLSSAQTIIPPYYEVVRIMRVR